MLQPTSTWAALTVNLAKCEFAKATITYLGKVVGQGLISPVKVKVPAVDQLPVPTTKRSSIASLVWWVTFAGFFLESSEIKSFGCETSSTSSPSGLDGTDHKKKKKQQGRLYLL